MEFLPATSGKLVKSADIQMDGVVWEIKCLETGKLSTLEKKVRKALHQSRNVIIDSRRMKGLNPSDIERKPPSARRRAPQPEPAHPDHQERRNR